MSDVNAKVTQSVTVSNVRGLMVAYETSIETNASDHDGDIHGGTNRFDASLIVELAEAFKMLAKHPSYRGLVGMDFDSAFVDELKLRKSEGGSLAAASSVGTWSLPNLACVPTEGPAGFIHSLFAGQAANSGDLLKEACTS